MKVSKLEDYLFNLYRTGVRFSVLLLGAPGIGKSYSVYSLAKKIAKAMNREFVEYDDDMALTMLNNPDRYFTLVDFRLTETEPSDLLGLPRDINSTVMYKPLLWARTLSKVPGILFLDELTNVQRLDIISAAYKLIFDRRAGFTTFNKDVMIIAAGNRPQESSIANMLPTPLISRMIVVEVDPPSVDDWKDFMVRTYRDEWDARVYAFLKRFEDEHYLIRIPKVAETLDAYPTPRTWSALSLLMKKGMDDAETITGLVGKEVGTKLSAFLKVNVDVDDLIREPERFHDLELDGKYMASVMLASWISKNIRSVSRCFRLIDEMSKESREFLVLTCISMNRNKLVHFLKELFRYSRVYRDALSEIALEIKEKIKAD